MVAPSLFLASLARRFPIVPAAILALLPTLAEAFVTMDTSATPPANAAVDTVHPAGSADTADTAGTVMPGEVRKAPFRNTSDAVAGEPKAVPSKPQGAVAPPLPTARPASARTPPHFRTVLFLSADNMLVYAYLGALKAMEEFKVGPDLVVAESKAVVVGAAWALDYRMVRVEERFLERPLSGFLKPLRQHGSLASRFTPFGPDPIQVEVPISLQSLQSPELHWDETPSREGDEFLHLSWMVAKLTHDAPGGPVEDLRETPKALAVQVADLAEERGRVLMEGNLQSLLKAGLLPVDAVHRRKRLWPYASGSLVSGHSLMPAALPFTFDRLLVIQPSRHLRPPSLEEAEKPWRDSLDQKLKAGSASDVIRIELNPDAGFNHDSRDPKVWMDLGYASALRSMDVLLSTLGKAPASDTSLRNQPGLPPPLGLDRLTVNPLASGGRQLLQDLVRQSATESRDSTGDVPISHLVKSGYYSDLDVEWVPSPGGELPALVFDAREKSRLLFQAAANAANSGEDLPDRGPEIYTALAWSEPFYVPFRAEGSILLGGHRPGYASRVLIEPIHPMHLELGISRKDWRIRYPDPPPHSLDLDPFTFRLDRRLGEIFLHLLPFQGLRLSAAIQKHEMTDRTSPASAPVEEDEPAPLPKFESTDFQGTGFFGLGQPGVSGLYRHSLWMRYRNLNRVNLFGPVKYSSSSLESRLRISFGDFRVLDQYYWSDQEIMDPGIFDYMEAGEILAYSFQDEFFYGSLRARRFHNAQAEFAPAIGKAGVRLLAGAFQVEGRSLNPFLGLDFSRIYWEAQVCYATPVGPFRAGLAGLAGEEDDSPIYFIRIGADLDLDRDGPED